MQINFYLKPVSNSTDLNNVFSKVIEYLLTFVGDIEVKKESSNSAIIYYVGSPAVAFLTLKEELIVTIHPEDNLTINLIKNIANNVGFRIFNPQNNCFLPNDVNVIDLTTIKLDINVKNVLNLYQLTPLFQYRDTLIFFCLNKSQEVVLVNRHFLEYLVNNKIEKKYPQEFSTKIADNISQFIALFDKGLISLTNPGSKIINLSGFDVNKLPKDTKLQVVNFIFDEQNQQFTQQDTTNKIPKKYMALKVGQDYSYKQSLPLRGRTTDKKLTKLLNVSVFHKI